MIEMMMLQQQEAEAEDIARRDTQEFWNLSFKILSSLMRFDLINY